MTSPPGESKHGLCETRPPAQGNASVPSQVDEQAAVRERTEALLRDLWQRKLPMVREHLRALDRAREVLEQATLHAPLRAEAAIAAHKLAGSLGMFGYSQGTLLAREIEAELDGDHSPQPARFAALLQGLRESLQL